MTKQKEGFWSNLKGLITHLPLILSDTQDPRDISLNRVSSVFAMVLALFILYEVMFVIPQHMKDLLQYFVAIMAYLGAQMAGNIYKKVQSGNQQIQQQNFNYQQQNNQQLEMILNNLKQPNQGYQQNQGFQVPPNHSSPPQGFTQQNRPPIPINNIPNIGTNNQIDREKG